MPQKRITTAYILVLLSVSAVLLPAMMLSCAREGSLQNGIVSGPSGELTLLPVGSKNTYGTRAVSEGGLMPESYVIYTSAYLTDTGEPENTGNYITACEFRHRSGNIWASSPKTYWPFHGKLDFLAVATDPVAMPIKTGMAFTARNTDGVTVTVPENDASAEILYAYDFPGSNDHASPEDLLFHHTQACVTFRVKSVVKGINRLDGITLDKVCTAGILHIATHSLTPSEEVVWEYDEAAGHSFAIGGIPSGGLKLNDTDWHTQDIALLPQDKSNFSLSFSQCTYDGNDWATVVPFTVRYNGASGKWEMGKRYIYNLTLNPEHITFSLTVEDMESGETETVYPTEVL